MINTAQFIQATLAQKEAMINDGLLFVAKQMEELERNARVLTGWMATYPDHVTLQYATLDKPVEVIQAIRQFSRRMDDLTAQLVNASIASEMLLQPYKKVHHQKTIAAMTEQDREEVRQIIRRELAIRGLDSQAATAAAPFYHAAQPGMKYIINNPQITVHCLHDWYILIVSVSNAARFVRP